MVSTRSMFNAFSPKSVLFEPEPSPIAKAVTAITDVTVTADVTADVTPVSTIVAGSGASKKEKKKRVRRELEYKSIVRTRGQKLREELAQLEKVAEFYKKWRYEPRMNAKSEAEVELATYLHNLRAMPVDKNLALKVGETLPWFQWSVSKKSFGLTDLLHAIGTIFLLSSLTSLYIGVQLHYQNGDNARKTLAWLNNALNQRPLLQ